MFVHVGEGNCQNYAILYTQFLSEKKLQLKIFIYFMLTLWQTCDKDKLELGM